MPVIPELGKVVAGELDPGIGVAGNCELVFLGSGLQIRPSAQTALSPNSRVAPHCLTFTVGNRWCFPGVKS